jgi:hypothetical protein
MALVFYFLKAQQQVPCSLKMARLNPEDYILYKLVDKERATARQLHTDMKVGYRNMVRNVAHLGRRLLGHVRFDWASAAIRMEAGVEDYCWEELCLPVKPETTDCETYHSQMAEILEMQEHQNEKFIYRLRVAMNFIKYLKVEIAQKKTYRCVPTPAKYDRATSIFIRAWTGGAKSDLKEEIPLSQSEPDQRRRRRRRRRTEDEAETSDLFSALRFSPLFHRGNTSY